MCSRHAATGAGSSSRVQNATASQSLSTSGSPKTCVAHPALGNAAIVQLIDREVICSRMISVISFICARPTRSPSRSASNSGSGSPAVWINTFPAVARNRVFCHSGVYASASSGPSSIIAFRTC